MITITRNRMRDALHISESMLGHQYRAWRSTPEGASYNCPVDAFAALNDLDPDSIEALREWEKAGFPGKPVPVVDGGICVKIYNENESRWPIQYHSDGAAGFDLPAAFTSEYRDVEAGRSWVFRCGVYLEIPRGYVGLVFCRSGLPFRHQVISHTGVVDSDYRGEIAVCLFNLGHQPIRVAQGDRIAQMVITVAPQVTFQSVASQGELENTDRGGRGFGSTGGFVGSTGVLDPPRYSNGACDMCDPSFSCFSSPSSCHKRIG